MVNNKLVSIIVPVYNAEKYIYDMLRSILDQQYNLLEVICVDDGSEDHSADIIKKLVKKDSRVKYIWQENRGVSAARNKGIKEAKGEYFCFLDADDFLDKEYLKIMVEVMQEQNADIVSCGYYHYYNEKNNVVMLANERCSLDRKDALKCVLENKKLGMSAWNKLFKKRVLPKDGFPEGFRINEDRYFVFNAITKANRIEIIPKALYYYRVNLESVSYQSFSEKFLDAITLSEKMYDWICMNNPDLIPEAYACKYSSLYGTLYMMYERKAGKEFHNIKKEIIKKISDVNLTMLKGKISKSRYYQLLGVKYCEPLLHMVIVGVIALKKRRGRNEN